MARRLVTSSMTSRDHDVILETSQYSKSWHLKASNRINYPRGPFKRTLKENIALKHDRIPITTYIYNCWRRSISRDRTPTKIRHFS